MGGPTILPQEGRLLGGQTGGATRRTRGSCERSSRIGREELRKGDQLFIERDRELAEMSLQPAELQTLFDEVSHQLCTECKRIEGVQETVNEAIHHKLEESHQMLTQMRDTRAW